MQPFCDISITLLICNGQSTICFSASLNYTGTGSSSCWEWVTFRELTLINALKNVEKCETERNMNVVNHIPRPIRILAELWHRNVWVIPETNLRWTPIQCLASHKPHLKPVLSPCAAHLVRLFSGIEPEMLDVGNQRLAQCANERTQWQDDVLNRSFIEKQGCFNSEKQTHRR